MNLSSTGTQVIVRYNGKITLYCKGAGKSVLSSLLSSSLFSLLSLLSSSLPSLTCVFQLLSHTPTPTDSVVFARLSEESSPLKKVTLDHLGVST